MKRGAEAGLIRDNPILRMVGARNELPIGIGLLLRAVTQEKPEIGFFGVVVKMDSGVTCNGLVEDGSDARHDEKVLDLELSTK